MADRIQARAIRRCGELLKQVESGQGKTNQYTVLHDGADTKQTRTEAAREAGMSERQKVTALRVANVPEPEFHQAVESEAPPIGGQPRYFLHACTCEYCAPRFFSRFRHAKGR